MFTHRHHPTYPTRIKTLGFTLVELLITVAVFGILAAIAMPNMSDLVNAQRVRTISGDLHSSLIFARSEAIKRNSLVKLCSANTAMNDCGGTTNWANGWLVFADANDNDTPEASEILQKQDARTNLTLTGSNGVVVYQRDGRLKTAVTAFVASSPSNTNITARCVSVDLGGRPNIKADTDQNASNGC